LLLGDATGHFEIKKMEWYNLYRKELWKFRRISQKTMRNQIPTKKEIMQLLLTELFRKR
jgi:hypothetical protein